METPVALVHASATMMTRLVAEESLLDATRVAVGTGSLGQDDAKAITGEWTRLTDVAKQRVVHRPSAADLAAIGVGLIEVPRG